METQTLEVTPEIQEPPKAKRPKANGHALIPVNPTPLDLLAIALQHQAGIDVIERLTALSNQDKARQAELEFNEALNRVQNEIRRIAPDSNNPQTHSKYASYAALDRVIRPAYSREGFSLSFNTADCAIPEHIRVICYVSKGSHTRTYQVDMPADGKGAKGGDVMTKTHAAGSALSYGMRYLLKGIFNVAIGAEDDDGNAAAGRNGNTQPQYQSLSSDHIQEQCEWMASAKDMPELKRLFGVAYKEAAVVRDADALDRFKAAYEARKKELQ